MSKDDQILTGRKMHKGMAGVVGGERRTACVSGVSIACARSEGLGGTSILNGARFARASVYDRLTISRQQGPEAPPGHSKWHAPVMQSTFINMKLFGLRLKHYV
jgi:hypothetical protein